jgi:hypothetical protein
MAHRPATFQASRRAHSVRHAHVAFHSNLVYLLVLTLAFLYLNWWVPVECMSHPPPPVDPRLGGRSHTVNAVHVSACRCFQGLKRRSVTERLAGHPHLGGRPAGKQLQQLKARSQQADGATT